MRVALLHDAKPEDSPAHLPDDAFEEYDSEATLEALSAALRPMDVEVDPVPADARLPWRLDEGKFDFAFNIAEGQGRRCREAIPAAVCELLGLPFTGSDAVTLGITLDKALAKRIVSPEVPVPRGVLVADSVDEDSLAGLAYPVIVKPNDEGSSKGIRDNPVARDAAGAAERCRWLKERYDCPVLVEEFLPGTEITVGIAGNGSRARVLGMMEIAPAADGTDFVYSLEVKRDYKRQVRYYTPPRAEPETLATLQRFALEVYRILGCRDIARIDFRLDSAGLPRFIECNPIPGMNPVTGDIVLSCRGAVPYEQLIQGVLRDAMGRYSNSSGTVAAVYDRRF